MSRRLLVEADGGSRGNPGPAAYGALVRDADTGDVLVEVAQAIGIASNNVAEYGGLVAGLRAAVALDPDCTIEVRMDSKLVVEQMSGRWKIKHEDMRRLALQARDVVDPARVRYVWVPRERNKAADRLANQALDDAARGLPWRAGATASLASPSRVPVLPDVGEPATLILVRHAVTALTSERRFSGSGGTDPALSALGRAQAEAVAQALVGSGVEVVVCSPLRRTRETAEVVAARLGLDVRTDEGWRECSFGDWDGCTAAQVAERWPDEHGEWLASTAAAPPGGDSLDELDARVLLARDQLLARHPRSTVLVVTHASPIKSLVRLAMGAPAQVVWRLESSPASLSQTRWWSDGGSALVSFNETGHLRAADLALR